MCFRVLNKDEEKKGDRKPELHRIAHLKTPRGKEWHPHKCLGCSYDVEAPQTLFPGRRGVEPPIVQLSGIRAHSAGLQVSTSNATDRHLYLCALSQFLFTLPASSAYTCPILPHLLSNSPPTFFLRK